MRCERARRAILERGLGALDAAAADELGRHLAGCRDCAAEAGVEDGITASLAGLRSPFPFELDVRAPVMARVRAIGPVPRQVTDRQIAWGAVAAATAVALLLAGGAPLVPYAAKLLDVLGALGRGVVTVVGGLAGPLAEILAVPLRVLGSPETWKALATGPLPAAFTVVAAAGLLAAATTAVVVGRDLLRPAAGARGVLA